MAKSSAFQAAVSAATRLKGLKLRNPKQPVKDLMEARKMTIEQVMELRSMAKPAPAQRQHEWRWFKGKARYLLKFVLPQAVLVVGVYNGEYYLVDGNTRTFGWSQNESLVVPDNMLVVFYDIASVAEMRTIYDAVDSSGSKKTFRNEVISTLREQGVDIENDFSSDYVLSGGLKGVIAALVGTGGKLALQQGLGYYCPAIRKLDKLKLREKPVKHSAVLATGLRLYTNGVPAALVDMFIMQFVHQHSGDTGDLLTCTPAIELAADKAFLAMAAKTKSTSSANAIKAMLPVYEQLFRTKFCVELAKGKRTDKLAVMARTVLKKAA